METRTTISITVILMYSISYHLSNHSTNCVELDQLLRRLNGKHNRYEQSGNRLMLGSNYCLFYFFKTWLLLCTCFLSRSLSHSIYIVVWIRRMKIEDWKKKKGKKLLIEATGEKCSYKAIEVDAISSTRVHFNVKIKTTGSFVNLEGKEHIKKPK